MTRTAPAIVEHQPVTGRAVLWRGRQPIGDVQVAAPIGDENGVVLGLCHREGDDELQLTVSEARRLVWSLHRALMAALAQGAEP